MDRTKERAERLRVWPAKEFEGHCEGCSDKHGVYVLLAGQHQTRFCRPCLEQIAAFAGIIKRK